MIRPTLQEIRTLHDCLKKEMSQFYPFDNYMKWEKEENSVNCPPEKTLWINNAYIENADDILEILNYTLENDISFIKIEKHLLKDAIYAKIRGNGSACCVLKSNVFNLLKKTHFSIQIKEEKKEKTICISLIVVAKLEQQAKEITLLKEETELTSRKKTYENVVMILKLLLCHVITINPVQGSSEIVRRVFGKLDEETKELFRYILENTFIKAFIHTYENDCRCLNPFASFLRKDFEDVRFESMWALEQQFSFSSSVTEAEEDLIEFIRDDKKNFKSHLKLSERSKKFSSPKIKDMNENDVVWNVKKMDDSWIANSESKVEVEVNGKKEAVNVKILFKYTWKKDVPIIKKNLSKSDSQRIEKEWRKNKELQSLSDDDKIKSQNIINASESQWLSRFEMFIKQLNIVAENEKLKEGSFKSKYPSWQKDVDNHQISLNAEEDIIKLKYYLEESVKKNNGRKYDITKEYDEIQKLATKIDFRRRKMTKRNKEIYETVIDESELSIILGILLNFIKENASNWHTLAIQCIRAFRSKEPCKVKGNGNQGKSKSVIDLMHDLETSKMKKRIIDAYLEDLYLAIQEKGGLDPYQLLMKHKYSNIALSEEIESIGTYKQNGKETALHENSVQIEKG